MQLEQFYMRQVNGSWVKDLRILTGSVHQSPWYLVGSGLRGPESGKEILARKSYHGPIFDWGRSGDCTARQLMCTVQPKLPTETMGDRGRSF